MINAVNCNKAFARGEAVSSRHVYYYRYYYVSF